MELRFRPGQEVWTPYKKRALCVVVVEIILREHEIEYEIQTMSELGHQAFETYTDTTEKKCNLFTTKQECEQWISNNPTENL